MPLVLFNKPYGVLSQFRDPGGRATLRDFVTERRVYPAGRLDADSEGLILLTDDGRLQARISQPRSKLPKGYWVQVDGLAEGLQLEALLGGVELKDGAARALEVRSIDAPPDLWPRDPPIRKRLSKPTSWLDLWIDEGRNRQVRRMTAAAGLPTLRLLRHTVGPWSLSGLPVAATRRISNASAWRCLQEYRYAPAPFR